MASVLANDSDAEDGVPAGQIDLIMAPASGQLTLNPDGTFSYEHDGSLMLSDSFVYTVADSAGAVSNQATVSFTLQAVNDPPVAVDDGAEVVRAGTVAVLSGGASSVRANDTDEEDGTPGGNVSLELGPTQGSLMLNDDGTFEYTHSGGVGSSDSFSYRVADADGELSAAATVTVTITEPPTELLFSDGFESR